MYKRVLEPLLKAHEEKIDAALNSVQKNGASVVAEGMGVAKDLSKAVAKAAADQMVNNSTK